MLSLKIATRAGQLFGLLMMIAGIWKLGFWFVFIGWFLYIMAPGEYKQLRVRKILTQIKAKDLMASLPQVSIEDAKTIMLKGEKEICNAEDDLTIVLKKMASAESPLLLVAENDKVVGFIIRSAIEEYIKSKM
jgi:hypothetical protein